MQRKIYWRLSSFYFVYFGFIGAFSPYWSLYLQSLGFASYQIGTLMALLPITRIFAPNIWGWLADHLGKQVGIIRLATVIGLISYIGFFFGDSYTWLFTVTLAMSFFWSASLPLVETTTLNHLGEESNKYGRIRLWGSIGFILAVIIVGYILDYVPIETLLWMVLAMKIAIVIFSTFIPESPKAFHQTDDALPVSTILKRPHVIAFFAACILMIMAHGPYQTFYSIFLVDHGYTKKAVGWFWALGVFIEVVVLFSLPRIFAQFSVHRLLLASFAAAVTRFLLIGWFVENVMLMVVAQLLHSISFGLYHASAIATVHRFFRGKHQAKGQALYISLAFGIGGSIGGLYSGYIWDFVGPAWSFTTGAFLAFLGLIVIWRALHLE
jgi:PPP family 3-phenylpropionic acid transporter